MQKILLFFFVFISCSTQPDEINFKTKLTGTYSLSLAGQEFLIREKIVTDIEIGADMVISANSDIRIGSGASEQTVFTFIELPRNDVGIFQVQGSPKYVAIKVEGALLAVTTNVKPSANKVLFEWFAPFARKNI